MNKFLIKNREVDEEIILRPVLPDVDLDYFVYPDKHFSQGEFLSRYLYQADEEAPLVYGNFPAIINLHNFKYVPIGAGGIFFTKDIAPGQERYIFIKQDDSSDLSGLPSFSVSCWVNFCNPASVITVGTYSHGSSTLATFKDPPFSCTIIDCPSFRIRYNVLDAENGELEFSIKVRNGVYTHTHVLAGNYRLHNLTNPSIGASTVVGWDETEDEGWVRLGFSCELATGKVSLNSSHPIFKPEGEAPADYEIELTNEGLPGYLITKLSDDPIIVAGDLSYDNFFYGLMNDLVVFASSWDKIPELTKNILNTGRGGEYVGFKDETDLAEAMILHFPFLSDELSEGDTVQNEAEETYGRLTQFGEGAPTTNELTGSASSNIAPSSFNPSWFYFLQTASRKTVLRVNEFPHFGPTPSFSIATWVAPEELGWSHGGLISEIPVTNSNAQRFFKTNRVIISKGDAQSLPDFDLMLTEGRPVEKTFRISFRITGKNRTQYVQYLSDPVQFRELTSPYTALPTHIALTYSGIPGNPGLSAKLYVNGSQVVLHYKIVGSFPGFVERSDTLWIGASNFHKQFFLGSMADFRILNRELLPREVSTLYNSGNGSIEVDAFEQVPHLFHYRLDDVGVFSNKILDWAYSYR